MNNSMKSKNYENCLKNIESQYEKLNSSFEKKMMSQNPSEYCKIYYSFNPYKKVEADSLYIECWCRYSQRSDFDLRFIKGKLKNKRRTANKRLYPIRVLVVN
jgi:hypothetical protein